MTIDDAGRRAFVVGAAAGALAGPASAQVARARRVSPPPTGILAYPDRSALAAAAGSEGDVAYLAESGREGMFLWRSGNRHAAVASDALQGLAVAPAVDPTGRSGAWLREWDGARGHPEWWGARVDDPAFDNLPALRACIAHCAETMLGLGWYHIHDTLQVNLDNRAIVGVCRSDEHAKANSSAIVLTGAYAATGDVLLIGHPLDYRPAGRPVAGWVG
ncbi:MAG: hypothetical protein EOP19_25545, partial [Hyphomicrobiales bacterium]